MLSGHYNTGTGADMMEKAREFDCYALTLPLSLWERGIY